MAALKDTNKSTTALRSFHVLETVAQSDVPLAVAQVAANAGLDRATCYRMLKTIEQAGYVVHDPNNNTYRLSRKILTLARNLLAQDESREMIDASLRALSRGTKETCHYSELDGFQTVLTQLSKGTQLVAVDFRIGTQSPLHITSVGKAILAFQSREFIDSYLERELERSTENTIATPEKLLAELRTIRETGISYDHEEMALGMNCVAVPVFQPDGHVLSGISISGPDSRFTEDYLAVLAQALRDEAKRLQQTLAGLS